MSILQSGIGQAYAGQLQTLQQQQNWLGQQLNYCPRCGTRSLGFHDCTAYPQSYGNINTTVTISGAPAMSYSGSKPLVVCNGQVTECKDLDEAQAKAEQLAHQHQADAFILRPVKKVAPKREVVTTDIP